MSGEQTLLDLAARVEAATGPDRELFEDVFRECFPKPERIWVTDNTGPWTDEYTEWQARQSRFYELLDAEAFESAAMTLVPEGLEWGVGFEMGRGTAFTNKADGSSFSHDWVAATPALALCASALRAIAHQMRIKGND